MPFIFTRIDDRLIHGQVVVGWGNHLKPHRIILCNDCIATTPWQKEIYSAAGTLAQHSVTISVWTEKETIKYFKENQNKQEKVILLVETPHEVLNLVEKGVPIENVNIGGMHFKQGKKQIAPYIYVNDNDLKYFRLLKNKNIKLEGQDVPTARKIDFNELIELI